jgi:hypothetical protein
MAFQKRLDRLRGGPQGDSSDANCALRVTAAATTSGVGRDAAIMQACQIRFRLVMMTCIAVKLASIANSSDSKRITKSLQIG